jgi:hypothetical protein
MPPSVPRPQPIEAFDNEHTLPRYVGTEEPSLDSCLALDDTAGVRWKLQHEGPITRYEK